MSVNTKILLDGHILPKTILNVIKNNIDKNARIRLYDNENMGKLSEYDFIKAHYGNSNNWEVNTCYIDYNDGYNGNVSIFYYYSNINSYENLQYYEKYNLSKMVKSEKTFLIFDFISNVIATPIYKLLLHFGGWIDVNDCDNIPYDRVDSNINVKKIYDEVFN